MATSKEKTLVHKKVSSSVAAQAIAKMARKRGMHVIQGYAKALSLASASSNFALMVTVL